MRLSSRTQGILWEINAALSLTVLMTLVKYMSKDIPTPLIVFARIVLGFLFVLPLTYMKGITKPKKSSIRWYVLRCFSAVFTVNALFYASSKLPLSISTAISYTEPMIQLILAMLFFGASISLMHWFLIILGYCGVFAIAYTKIAYNEHKVSDTTTFIIAVGVALLGSLFIGLVKVFTKRLTKEEPAHQVIFYSNVCNIIISFIVVSGYLFANKTAIPKTIPSYCFWGFPLLGFFGFMIQYSFTKALSLTDMHVLSPIAYLRLLFALPISYFLYDEVPTWATIAGSLVIIAANFFLLRPKKQ